MTELYATLRARLARAMRAAVIRDDEGEFPSLFDMLGFSGENKAHAVVNGLADAVLRELVQQPAPQTLFDWAEAYRQARLAEDSCVLQDCDAPYAAGGRALQALVEASYVPGTEFDLAATALAAIIMQQDPEWKQAKARIAQLEGLLNSAE